MKNWKNHPKKLLRIGPDHFFPLTSQGHSPQPKIDFPYHEISGPDICSLICDPDGSSLFDVFPEFVGAVKSDSNLNFMGSCWQDITG